MHRKQWIFDMDGTLTDSMTVVWQGAPLELLRRYGRTARPGIHDVLLSMGMVEGAEYLIRTYDLPLTLRDYEPAMRQVIRDLYKKVELKPGVREILDALRQNGWKTAIASSTRTAVVREEMQHFGLEQMFDEIIGGDMVRRSKPDPEIYLTACRVLGADPAETYAVEDSYNGIRSAAAAGMRPVMIPDLLPPTPEIESLTAKIFPSMTEFQQFLFS